MSTIIRLSSLPVPKPESQQAITLEILARLWLPEEAFLYGERYQHPMRKLSFYASRLLLRMTFSEYYQCPPQAPRFNRLDSGALAQTNDNLESQHKNQLLFSVTHAVDRVFLATIPAINVKKLGIDTEPLDRDFNPDKLVKRYFSGEVQQWFSGLSPKQKNHAFLSLWTQAEAFFKATQLGLKGGIQKLNFLINRPDPILNQIQSKLGYKAKTLGWRVTQPEIPNYALAIAYYARNRRNTYPIRYRAESINSLENFT
jgi:phosphopantetheinyl transferase